MDSWNTKSILMSNSDALYYQIYSPGIYQPILRGLTIYQPILRGLNLAQQSNGTRCAFRLTTQLYNHM